LALDLIRNSNPVRRTTFATRAISAANSYTLQHRILFPPRCGTYLFAVNEVIVNNNELLLELNTTDIYIFEIVIPGNCWILPP
jgi:hypothetical protein